MPDQAKHIMQHPAFGYVVTIIGSLAFIGFATILICCCRFLTYLCNRLCYGTHIQRHDGVDSRPYVLPTIDPNAIVQDHPDQHQLQVNLPPNDIQSASRLDLMDLPPPYEEVVKMTMSTQV